MEKKALEEIEQLKAELQQAKTDNSLQDQTLKELSENLDFEKSENHTLWNQVEYLTEEFNKHKNKQKENAKEIQREIAKRMKAETLKKKYAEKLEKAKKELAYHKNKEERLVKREEETKSELETLKASFQDLQEKYRSYLLVAKLRDEKLQMQLEFQETIQRLKAEQDAFKQDMVQKVRLLQQHASEREESFCREMEDLRLQFQEKMMTAVKEQVSQALQDQTPNLDESTQQVKEEEEPLSLAVKLHEGAPDSEENAPKKKKKKSFWKRLCHFFSLKKKKKEKGQESTST